MPCQILSTEKFTTFLNLIRNTDYSQTTTQESEAAYNKTTE